MMTLNDGRTELWQWDTGRKLTVDVDCSQVHFSNKVFGRSVDVDVVDGTAAIPDVLLQVDKELIAWAFVGTAENGYTKISKVFKVKKRNKPADYVFTPPEQTTLQKLVERLTAIEESQDPDAIKNAVEDYLEQNPVESPVQSVNGYTGNVELTAKDVGAISKDKLQEATNEALAQAKASGEFDGANGSPGPKGDGGKSAYEYAREGGYQGTEKQFTAKMAAEIPNKTSQLENDSGFITAEDIPESSGGSGIHIGPEPPTDPNVVLWIDTDEDVAQTFIKAPETSEVGQTIVVKAVDENGAPTEWEAVDMPSVGGEKEWKLLRRFTLPDDPSKDVSGIEWTMCTFEEYSEQIASFAFSEDANGQPFDIHEILMNANTGYGRIQNYFGLADQDGRLGYGNLFCNRNVFAASDKFTQVAVYVKVFNGVAYSLCVKDDDYSGQMAGKVTKNERKSNSVTKIQFGTFADCSILPGSTFEFWGR